MVYDYDAEGKKNEPLVSSSVSSISVSAKYSIILSKYAEDLASVLRLGLFLPSNICSASPLIGQDRSLARRLSAIGYFLQL